MEHILDQVSEILAVDYGGLTWRCPYGSNRGSGQRTAVNRTGDVFVRRPIQEPEMRAFAYRLQTPHYRRSLHNLLVLIHHRFPSWLRSAELND
jgi:hypothetical protein